MTRLRSGDRSGRSTAKRPGGSFAILHGQRRRHSSVRFTSDAVWETTSSLALINHWQLFQLHRHLRELVPGSRFARMGGRELAERTAEAMAAYWLAVLEPLWDRLDAITGADIARGLSRWRPTGSNEHSMS